LKQAKYSETAKELKDTVQ